MPQSVVLLKELKEPDVLHRLQRSGDLRVSVTFLPGACYAGMGIAAHPEAARSLSLASAPLQSTYDLPCPPNCDVYELLEYLNKVSPNEPTPEMAFVPVTVLNGARQEWQAQVIDIAKQAPEDVYVAAAHLFGGGAHNGLIEVLARDRGTLLDLVLQLTDIQGVVDARVLRTVAGSTQGMGTVVEGM